MKLNSGLTAINRVFGFILVLWIALLVLISFAVWQTVRNQQMQSHKQLIDSVLKVAREPISARDEIRIQHVLEAFHEPGSYFRLVLPKNFEVLWPREFFDPIWKKDPNYRATVSVGDGQRLEVEYWTTRRPSGEMPIFGALAVSAVLSLFSIFALANHMRSWRADVARIEDYLRGPENDLDADSMQLGFFNQLARNLMEKELERRNRFELEKRAEALRSLASFASQVAHDIRSPLTALRVAKRSLGSLQQEEKALVEAAIDRVRSIADSLLLKEKEMKGLVDSCRPTSDAMSRLLPRQDSSALLLPLLLQPIIDEKRLIYREREALKIVADVNLDAEGPFVCVHADEFQRVLSNLIDNAVEAVPEAGSIVISTKCFEKWIEIQIKDTGKGIPEEVIPLLGQRGATFGKSAGSGLGLHHAKSSVEAWSGSLKIESKVGVGTTVTVCLPKQQTLSWYSHVLRLNCEDDLVIVDDDPSIHIFWRRQLETKGVTRLYSLFTPEELDLWINADTAAAARATYLIDLEFSGSDRTGLTLIQDHALRERCSLVTSRLDNLTVLETCEQLDIRIFPKDILGLILIDAINPPRGLRSILSNPEPLTARV